MTAQRDDEHEPDDLDRFIAEQMQDPEFRRAYGLIKLRQVVADELAEFGITDLHSDKARLVLGSGYFMLFPEKNT